MFEAGGFGVAVTVQEPSPMPAEPLPAGVTRRRSRLVEVLEPRGFTDAGLVGELRAIGDARAQLAAYEAGIVAELAARRPVSSDLTADQPGHGVEGWLPARAPVAVSEFLADELAMVTGTSRTAATVLAERSLVFVRELPETWAALADGLIDLARANAIVGALGGQSADAGGEVDPSIVAAVELQALAWARAGETPVRLRERSAAALIALDDAAADRRRKKAERHADVSVRSLPDGMAELTAQLPAAVAVACRETVDSYARMAKADGDGRPIGVLRAQVLADLVLRPWDTSREPVTAHLAVVAPLPTVTAGSSTSADRAPTDASTATVDGAPITAAQLRELLGQLDAVCPGGVQAPTGGGLSIDLTDPRTGALRATLSRPELERLARRGCPDHRQHECGCAVLDRPPAVDRYTPTPAQYRHVKARDRRCRHPGCRRPAAATDVDHVVPYDEGGPTDCANLCCLCRRHHRLKTHAPHWSYRMTPEGTLLVTTPSGVTRATRPPGADCAVADPDDAPPF